MSSSTHSHGPFIHVRTVNQYVSHILSTKRSLHASVPRQASPYVQTISGQRTFASSSFGMSGVNAHAICEASSHTWQEPGMSHFLFYKKRCWPHPAMGSLMDRFIASSRSFSVVLESPSLSWLKDHQIWGKSIISASSLLEITIRVSSCLVAGEGDKEVGVSGVVFKQPLDQEGRCSITLSKSAFLLMGPKRSVVCTGLYEKLTSHMNNSMGGSSHERRYGALCSTLSLFEVSAFHSNIAMLAEPKVPTTG